MHDESFSKVAASSSSPQRSYACVGACANRKNAWIRDFFGIEKNVCTSYNSLPCTGRKVSGSTTTRWTRVLTATGCRCSPLSFLEPVHVALSQASVTGERVNQTQPSGRPFPQGFLPGECEAAEQACQAPSRHQRTLGNHQERLPEARGTKTVPRPRPSLLKKCQHQKGSMCERSRAVSAETLSL